uniref:Uncharacterized protein n=1 Tax=Ectopseudomonas oleovorans TaxID=301 RepID=A0A653BCB5_ECTOL
MLTLSSQLTPAPQYTPHFCQRWQTVEVDSLSQRITFLTFHLDALPVGLASVSSQD